MKNYDGDVVEPISRFAGAAISNSILTDVEGQVRSSPGRDLCPSGGSTERVASLDADRVVRVCKSRREVDLVLSGSKTSYVEHTFGSDLVVCPSCRSVRLKRPMQRTQG